MSDGVTHKKAHDKLYPVAIILGLVESFIFIKLPYYNVYSFWLFYIIFYALGENYISPDLDLISMTKEESNLFQLKKKNIILGLIGLFWMIMCLIYAWIIEKNRSFWSHGIGIGTILRILWFLIVPLLSLMNWIASINGWAIKDYFYEFYGEFWMLSLLLGSFCALFFSDLIHLFMDGYFAGKGNTK